MGKASTFQVKLSGVWADYDAVEDKILKRAFLAGHPNASYRLRGNQYAVDFRSMTQVNKTSGRSRDIRPPYRLTPPAEPVVASGPTVCVAVPPGAPGATIQVPHPKDKRRVIEVEVPATAKVGQAMLVPVPELPSFPEPSAPPAPPTGAPRTPAPVAEKRRGYSTGAKVAAGMGGAAVVGGVVAGGLLGAHIAEDGWDAAMADLADGAGDVGDAIADGAEEAGEWLEGAAGAAGDFITDLF